MCAGLFRLLFCNNSRDLVKHVIFLLLPMTGEARADSAVIVAAAYYLPAGDAESVA